MLRPQYPILTERLTLRPFIEDDFDSLYAIQSRAEVAKYLYWEPRNAEQVRENLARRLTKTELRDEGDALHLAAVCQDSNELVGDALLVWASKEHQQGEIGYVLHPDHQGRGYATEMTLALLRLGFEGLGLHRIYGRCDGRNLASTRVMRKAGMRCEAHLRENEFVKGEWCDELVYAILRSEWTTSGPY